VKEPEMLSFSKDTLSYSENVIICWKICEKTVKPWSSLFVFRRKINFFYHKNHVYYNVSADGRFSIFVPPQNITPDFFPSGTGDFRRLYE
jgi:hypothetical protein